MVLTVGKRMDHSARSKRTSHACERCRARKVKCSGTQPCDKCRNRQQDCVFEEDRKIVVSEELLLSLKRKVSELEGSLTSTPSKRPRVLQSHASYSESISSKEALQSASEPGGLATPEQQELNRHDERFAANPLVSPSTYVKNNRRTQRAWLLLGPTSTWSFSRRVLSTIQTRLSPTCTKSIPLAVDGDAYQIYWRQASSEEVPDRSGLPSRDQAIYMLNTVCFHFGHLYQPFDEEDFTRNLDEFYCNASAKVQESRLWYVQFLVVLAFGEALLAPVRRASNTASWTKYFSRAMSLLPDTTALWQDPLLAIEVLALIALYLHSVDMRDSAYCYIGHAMRMALVEGLHRALPVEQLGEKRVERCTKIWWTVYILDRKFSSLIGSPTSVNDEDVTTILWDLKTCSQEAAALSLHVKITQVITRVLNSTLPDHSYRDMGFSLLDEMIARGNRVAQLRRSEIELLEELVQPLIRPETTRPEEDPGSPLMEALNERNCVAQQRHHGMAADAEGPGPTPAVTVTGAQEEDLLFDWRDFGLSLNHMLSATDELNANSLVPGAESEELSADLWL
ncbi:transcription factor C6 [Aspergillus fumigatus]|nr:transcription factor C6 [Aspergillus fumigatus]